VTSEVYFTVRDGVLRISRGDPPTKWEGLPDGLPVLDLRMAAAAEAAVVLLDAPSGGGHVQNLVRVEPDGRISWRGELPSGSATDCFVSLEMDQGGDIIASTWSGYRVRLAGRDGRLLESVFTK
jgi:hypothetical protein